MGIVDYWCNAFTPDRRTLWDEAIAAQGIPIKLASEEGDGFAEPSAMIARMDELGIDTLLLPTAAVPEGAGPLAYERYATHPADLGQLAADHAGRFAGLFGVDPSAGHLGVRRAALALAEEPIVGLQLHTHSWDRAFDHRDLYPFYALAADQDVPVVVQAGSSGGLHPSECGRPVGIDRPALYFRDVRFVLSHTGWPWGDEAIAMAQKHPNVFLGTGAWPPHHWSPDLVRFLKGSGRGKTLFGTSFPVVGHRRALAKLADLDLSDDARHALLEGAARTVFTRLRSIRSAARE